MTDEQSNGAHCARESPGGAFKDPGVPWVTSKIGQRQMGSRSVAQWMLITHETIRS